MPHEEQRTEVTVYSKEVGKKSEHHDNDKRLCHDRGMPQFVSDVT